MLILKFKILIKFIPIFYRKKFAQISYIHYASNILNNSQSSKPCSSGIAIKTWKVASPSHPKYHKSNRLSYQGGGFLQALDGLDPM